MRNLSRDTTNRAADRGSLTLRWCMRFLNFFFFFLSDSLLKEYAENIFIRLIEIKINFQSSTLEVLKSRSLLRRYDIMRLYEKRNKCNASKWRIKMLSS